MSKGLPADLKPECITVLVDSREQKPLEIQQSMRTEVASLQTGDYQIRGMPSEAVVERKELGDLLGCLGRDRARWERELERLMAFRSPMLLIESDWDEIELGAWRSRLTPSHVIGSLMGLAESGLSVVMAGSGMESHRRAGVLASRFLFIAARRRWRELQAFRNDVADCCG